MGSIIGLQIDYNGRGQRHITQQKLTRAPPPPPPPPPPGPGLAPVYVHGLCLDPFCPTKHLPVNNGNTESALKITIVCGFRPLRNVDQRETSAKVVYVVCHKRFRCEQDAKFGAITRSSILKIVQFNHASLE